MTTELIADRVADVCGSGVNLDKCECVTAVGFKEREQANQYCGICDGTGKPTIDMLVSKIDKLNEDIGDLESTAGDICEPAKKFLSLAWWHAEHAYRELTGHCSLWTSKDQASHREGRYCACCARYAELKNLAERISRSL